MKKCNGCNKEIDKYAIACDYCGKVAEQREKAEKETPKEKDPEKKNGEK